MIPRPVAWPWVEGVIGAARENRPFAAHGGGDGEHVARRLLQRDCLLGQLHTVGRMARETDAAMLWSDHVQAVGG